MVHREVREKVSKKETAIYHFDVNLNNYFTLVQEERKHLERGHHSLRILTNKIPSVFFFFNLWCLIKFIAWVSQLGNIKYKINGLTECLKIASRISVLTFSNLRSSLLKNSFW